MPKKLSIPSVRASAAQQQENFAQAANSLIKLESVELDGASLDDLALIVREAHQSYQSHLVSALQAALIAGRALIEAKQKFVYNRDVGGFRGWVTDVGLSRSTCYRYIDLAQHNEIVSQAETLSEALELLSQYKAEKRALKSAESSNELRKRRATLTLKKERDEKLEAIAASRGIEVSSLIVDVLDKWLARQAYPHQIDA